MKYKGPQPEQFAKAGTEHGHQVAFFVWAAQQFATRPELRTMFAIPNGGERNKIVAANLKAEGCRAGVPDVLLPVARGKWHGLFIELKRPTSDGKQRGYRTPEQVLWGTMLQDQGYGVAEAVGWEQARDITIAYLDWKG
jgi:hypothetical protein